MAYFEDLSIAQDIAAVSEKQIQDSEALVFPQIPAVDSATFDGFIVRYPEDEFLTAGTDEDLALNASGEASEGVLNPPTRERIEIHEKAKGYWVDRDAIARAAAGGRFLDPLQDASDKAASEIALNMENTAATLLFGTGNYTGDNLITIAAGSEFDVPGVKPFGVIEQAKETCVISTAGRGANLLIAGYKAMQACMLNDDITGKISTNEDRFASAFSRGRLASVFDVPVERTFIGRSVHKPAGAARTFCWDDKILLAYIDPAPKRDGMTLAARFVEEEYSVQIEPGSEKKWRMTWVEGHEKQQIKLVNFKFGVLIANLHS